MNNMRTKLYTILFLFAALLLGCSPTRRDVKEVDLPVPIYPDYTNITIPYNIAPLNFVMREGVDKVCVQVEGEHSQFELTAMHVVRFPFRRWKRFMEKERGCTVKVRITALIDEQWFRFPAFTWQVTEEAIDPYLSYRLIEPGYEVWNKLQLRERNVENFDERILIDNQDTDGSCINCHIHNNARGDLSFFHLRGKRGGTFLNHDGEMRKLNLRTDSFPNGAVYGDLHPSGRYGVFSSNQIIPAFHAAVDRRLEVYDTSSDLLIADFDSRRLSTSPLVSGPERLETFPVFSSQGDSVYFCVANAPEHPEQADSVHYALCRIAFDAHSGNWGDRIDTLWQAANGSANFPKLSPDGRYLLFTESAQGTFPLWHREADLRMIDLRSGAIDSLQTVNAPQHSDTYHSWSSNSRWFVFASKRGDGIYGKPYFAYIDAEGRAHKPFLLPQEDPEHYDLTLKSYNIPELSASPVPFDAACVRQHYRRQEAETFE